MSRVDLIDLSQAPLAVQSFYSRGDPGPIVRALANVPELVAPTLNFINAALGAGAANLRQKEIAILRTSALQQCRYCTATHSVMSMDAGLSTDEIRALRGEVPLIGVFADTAELALLAWIDVVGGSAGPVSDQIWETARLHWPEHMLIELMVTIGATLFLNRLATGLELPTKPSHLDRLADAGLS